MLENIGTKIKLLAVVSYWIEVIASVLFGIITLFKGADIFNGWIMVLILVLTILSPFILYLPFLLIYGLGIVVERAENEDWYRKNNDAPTISEEEKQYEKNTVKAYSHTQAQRY